MPLEQRHSCGGGSVRRLPAASGLSEQAQELQLLHRLRRRAARAGIIREGTKAGRRACRHKDWISARSLL